MQVNFEKALMSCTSPGDTLPVLAKLFRELTRQKLVVVYVAGAVSADGEDKIAENIKTLQSYCDTLNKELEAASGYAFTSSDILTPKVYRELGLATMPVMDREIAIQDLFDKVLELGVVTDMYLTPGWERSKGAQREYETATRLQIPIHFL
jgi:hypothetical protein